MAGRRRLQHLSVDEAGCQCARRRTRFLLSSRTLEVFPFLVRHLFHERERRRRRSPCPSDADDASLMGHAVYFLFLFLFFVKTVFLVRHLFVSGPTGRHRWPGLGSQDGERGSHRCCVLEYPSRAWVYAVHARYLLYCVRGGYPLESENVYKVTEL